MRLQTPYSKVIKLQCALPKNHLRTRSCRTLPSRITSLKRHFSFRSRVKRDAIRFAGSRLVARSIFADILLDLPGLTQAITAQADADSSFDCVSRCFAPELDVYEDPVTGSTHCAIAPLWAEKLGKNDIKAFQASKRTGILNCRIEGDRVKISGPAVLYARAELNI